MKRTWAPGTETVISVLCVWTYTSALTCVIPATTSSVNRVWGHWLKTAPPTPPVPSAGRSSLTSSSRRVSAWTKSTSYTNKYHLNKYFTFTYDSTECFTLGNVKHIKHSHTLRRSVFRGPSCRNPIGSGVDLLFSSDQMSHPQDKIKQDLNTFVQCLLMEIRSRILSGWVSVQMFWRVFYVALWPLHTDYIVHVHD